MRRLATLSLCTCLAACFAPGCASTQQTARTVKPQSRTFWSADGRGARTELVSRSGTESSVRFAKRENSSGLSDLLGGGSSDRIPLPRTEALRDVDVSRSADQPIGAF